MISTNGKSELSTKILPAKTLESKKLESKTLPTSKSIPSKTNTLPQKSISSRLTTVRYQIASKLKNLNNQNKILVIGARYVGKTSLINSLWCAMSGETSEIAGPGKPKFHLGQNCIYAKRSSSKNKHTSLQLFDTRGIQDIHDNKKTALILQYILEGRITKGFFKQSLMMDADTLKNRLKSNKIDMDGFFKAVIFVESNNPTPSMVEQTDRLADCLRTALSESRFMRLKHIPIIRTVNGCEPEIIEDIGRRMSTVSTMPSLRRDADRDYGLPSSFHSLDSYQWKDSKANLEIDPEDLQHFSPKVAFDAGIESESADSEENDSKSSQVSESSSNSSKPTKTSKIRRNSNGSSSTTESSKSRFLFPARQGPDEISAEQHLSLLLYLNDLLKIILDPECSLAIHSRLDKSSMVRASAGISGNNLCMSVFKLLFAN